LIVMVFVLGPCDSFGVQEKSPLDELILAPTGAPMRLKASVFAGRSESEAEALNEMGKQLIIRNVTDWVQDGSDISLQLTVIVMVSGSLRGGDPLSVTRTVIE